MPDPATYRVVETPNKYVPSGKLYVLQMLEDEEGLEHLEVGDIVEARKCEEDR